MNNLSELIINYLNQIINKVLIKKINLLMISYILLNPIYMQICPPADTTQIISVQNNWNFPFQNNWNGLEIMTWNVKEFPLIDNLTENNIQEVISDLQNDIIAFQEISNLSDYEYLANNTQGYDFISTDYWGDFALNLGFAYRNDCISLNSYSTLFNSEGYNFAWRYPMLAHFTWECGEASFDFRVINVHFKAYDDEESFQRRLAASQIVVEYLINQLEIGNSRFILLGDFNDEIHLSQNQNSLWPLVSHPESIQFITEQLTGNSYNDSYIHGGGSLIDHIAISSGMYDMQNNDLVQTLRLDDITGFSTYSNQFSDHRPIQWKTTINLPEVAEGLVINEIMNNPDVLSDGTSEWFEITNIGNEAIILNNYLIKDQGQDSHVISSGIDLILEPEGFFVLGINSDLQTNGGINIDYEYSNYYLSNSFDEIQIVHPNGTILDEVWYDNGNTFPDPVGKSMSLLDPMLDNNTGLNWQIAESIMSNGDFGSPGSPNFECEEQVWFQDLDNDGLGDPNSWVLDCQQPEGYVANANDPDPFCSTNDTDVCGVCGGPGVNGDSNQDNLINVIDVVLVVNYILGSGSFDELSLCRVNVNQDNSVNIVDVVLIVNLILSIEQ